MFSNLGITSGPTPFASNPATTSGQSGPSLFGNTTSTSAPPTGGLFSNLGGAQPATSSPPPTGSLFDRIGPTNTSQQTSTAATTAPSLFSNLGGASTSQAP